MAHFDFFYKNSIRFEFLMMKKMLRINYAVFLLLFAYCCFVEPKTAFAQFGGRKSFSFLNNAGAGRVLGLGGVNLTASDDDVQMFVHNPALLNEKIKNHFTFTHTSFARQAGRTFLAGVLNVRNKHIGFFLNYNSYGDFIAADNAGNKTGTFSASEYFMGLSYAHKITHYSLGANLKFAGSNIDAFSQYGLFADLAAAFIHPEKDFKIALLMKNFGFPLKKFYADSPYLSPADVQIGTSIKPDNMPLRMSLTFHQLFNNKNAYNDPNLYTEFDANGNPVVKEISGFNRFSRKIVLAGELLLGKYLRASLGYNFLTRREMITSARAGMTGLSYGFFAKLKWLEVGFSQEIHHVGGNATAFSVSIFSDKIRKKTINE
jgi:hypothetical protein